MPNKQDDPKIQQAALDLKNQLQEKLKSHPELNNIWCTKKFVLARGGNLEKAKIMLSNYIKYREENFDRIKNKKINKEKMDKMNCRGLYKTTKNGVPILIERIGYTDAKKIMTEYSKEDVIDYYTQFYERLVHIVFPCASEKQGKRVDKIFSIIDLKNSNLLSLLHSDYKSFLKSYTELSQNYYPEMLSKLVIINAPFVFKAVWAIVKHWVDKKTRQKFIIHNGDGMETLLQYIDIENIPVELGGTSRETLYQQPGPWQPKLDLAIKENRMEEKNDELFVEYFLTDDEKQKQKINLKKESIKIYKSSIDQAQYEKFLFYPESKSRRFNSVVYKVNAHPEFQLNCNLKQIKYGKIKRNNQHKKHIYQQRFSTILCICI